MVLIWGVLGIIVVLVLVWLLCKLEVLIDSVIDDIGLVIMGMEGVGEGGGRLLLLYMLVV